MTQSRSIPPAGLYLPGRIIDPFEDEADLATPRANTEYRPSPLSQVTARRQTAESRHTMFEEYDEEPPSAVEESQFLPLQLSKSLKRTLKSPGITLGQLDTFNIPSPSLWPNIKRGSDSSNSIVPSMPCTPLSPLALAALDPSRLQACIIHDAPSMTDGSSMTDEAPSMSCPDTPSLASMTDDDTPWGSNFDNSPMIGCELPPLAMETLMRLSSENSSFDMMDDDFDDVLVMDDYEMTDKGLNIKLNEPEALTPIDEDDQLSPISIPSPGGFFSNLRKSSAEIWTLPEEADAPLVGSPDSLYSLPQPPVASENTQAAEAPAADESEDPLTARRITFDLDTLLGPECMLYDADYVPFDEADSDHLQGSDVHDQANEQQLSETASDYASRTNAWIMQQEALMDKLRRTETRKEAKASAQRPSQSRPTTPVKQTHQRSASDPGLVAESLNTTPSKKIVRFADDVANQASGPKPQGASDPPKDSVLYHAFQHLTAHAKPRDAYLNREARAEALRMQRRYRRDVHKQRLLGSFALEDVVTKDMIKEKGWVYSGRPIPKDEQAAKEEQRKTLSGNSKQRRALEQLDLNTWYLQAMRFLDNGSLLPVEAGNHIDKCLYHNKAPRVLDFGGQPTASWGWAISVEHRDAKVYTVCPGANSIKSDWLAHRGPSNHRIATVENAWTLPFASGFFDVISARSLHTMLKTVRPSFLNGKDEWEATLAELHRVLAPGGIMHFSLMDAEVSAPSQTALAGKSVEFAVALRGRGYDATAGRHMLQRLAGVGFADVEQSWTSLPWATSEKQNNDAVTGLLGSVTWEQWMLKFQIEIGKPTEMLLEGVAEALEEARQVEMLEGGAVVWRVLDGCARKC